MSKPSIPQPPKAGQPRELFDQSIKENLEILTGKRNNKIERISADASLADVVRKVNQMIDRLQ